MALFEILSNFIYFILFWWVFSLVETIKTEYLAGFSKIKKLEPKFYGIFLEIRLGKMSRQIFHTILSNSFLGLPKILLIFPRNDLTRHNHGRNAKSGSKCATVAKQTASR
jgi:hypothetical protein